MKKKNLFIAGLLMLGMLICLSACQPTPKEPIVVNKAGDAMEKIIDSTPVPTIPEETLGAQNAEITYKTLGHWQDSFSAGTANIEIDADIIMPGMPAIPVYQVSPAEFDERDVDKVIEVFMGDAQLSNYEYSTRSRIEEYIVESEAVLAEYKAGNLPPDDDRPAEQQINELEGRIEELKQEYANAPEDFIQPGPADTSFKQTEFGHTVNLYGKSADGRECILTVTNSKEFGSAMFYGVCGADNLKGDNKRISPEEAQGFIDNGVLDIEASKELAERYIQSMGITDYYFVHTEIFYRVTPSGDVPVCSVNYTRTYGGLPFKNYSPWPRPLSSDDIQEEPLYAKVASPEDICVITDGTTVYTFGWSNPYIVENVRNENVQTYSTDEVKQRIKKQLEINLAVDGNIFDDVNVNISSVVMGSFYMPVRDEQDVYMMIPVWDTLGDETYEGGKPRFNGFSVYGEDVDNVSFVTVNAVDGSIIDRERGY